MNNIFKALIAGYGAKKLGGGCFSTILVFVLIWILLEQCGAAPAYVSEKAPPPVPEPNKTEYVDAAGSPSDRAPKTYTAEDLLCIEPL